MKKLKLDFFANTRRGIARHACRQRMVVVPAASRQIAEQHDDEQAEGHTPHKNCCRSHMVVVPGYGSPEMRLPSADEIAKSIAVRVARVTAARHRAVASGVESDADRLTAKIIEPLGIVAPLGGPGSDDKVVAPASCPPAGGSPALFAAAEGLRVIFHNGRFDAVVADTFDELTGAVNWARHNMEAKYQPAIESLRMHLDRLKRLKRDTLPKVIDFLAAQAPDASEDELLVAASELIDGQLREFLFVMRIYSQAFGQLRDGEYEELKAVIETLEQAYHLFRTGDVTGICDEECQKRLKTRIFGVEDVFVARFSGFGPATIPGTRGPIGAHALEVPQDERSIIMIMLVLYLHEFFHDIFYDVEGLAEEMTRVVVEAVKKAAKAGKFKFSAEWAKLGNQKVAMADLVTKIYADTLSEVVADVAALLLAGPAFNKNMILTFSAFNAKKNGVFNQDVLLRAFSHYEVGENGHLNFEVHLPDFIRVHANAATLELMGFPGDAAEDRQLADQAGGVPVPTEITWHDADGKRKMVIKVACSDLKQVAPVVAEAITKTPLKSLGGVALERIINFTARRQNKVMALVRNITAGKPEVPADMGDFYATYLAAACTLAQWELVKAGVHPIHAAAQVQTRGLEMLAEIKRRVAAKKINGSNGTSYPAFPAAHPVTAPGAAAPTASGDAGGGGEDCPCGSSSADGGQDVPAGEDSRDPDRDDWQSRG